GLKNPTHGSLVVGVNSVIAAQNPHVAAFDGDEVQTHGNDYAHLVLRGSNQSPNYSIAHLEEVKNQMEIHQIKNPAVVIDVSHDNCFRNGVKDPQLQPEIVTEVIKNLQTRDDLKKLVKGFMLESFIKEGCQKVDIENPTAIDLSGLSIT